MLRSSLTLALCMCALSTACAAADAVFDDPRHGAAPCLALSRFDAGVAETRQTARAPVASFENICSRALEAEICFELLADAQAEARHCIARELRPMSRATIAYAQATRRVVGIGYRWRYLPAP